jgi:hypothetical protein
MLILTERKPKVQADVLTFAEAFDLYKNKCLKSPKKRKWATVEGFSLDFDTSIDVLKKCYFVYTDNKEIIDFLKNNYTIVEYVE